MKVQVLDHQGKSRAIVEALVSRGCEIVDDPRTADVVLIDHDIPAHGKLPYAEACVEAGGRAFLYPHGAGSGLMAMWDGLFPISPIIDGVLVSGPGHIEVARRYGYPHPVHDIGWTLCEQRPRRATYRVQNVLFAANHPKGDGHLSDWKVARNQDILTRLCEAGSNITVRYIGTLEQNGLPHVAGVNYHQAEMGDFTEQLAQIDRADVVVSDRSTFSNLAIARGVTVVMFDSAIIAKDLDREHRTDHIDRYYDYIKYPFDAEDGLDIGELMHAAARDEDLVGDFRERFVGRPLDPERLLDVLHGDGAHLDPIRRSARLHAAAIARIEHGDVTVGHELIAQAIDRSFNLELLSDLAVIRWNLGQRGDAETLLRACLAIDPTNRSAVENLAAITTARAA